ncbi:MAG: glycosyltransferase family 39 protein [candidate division Zixibacteria bacterium]|nr:glycosyltransferase family 39 protein [candidate division Zixibacteria bacterium]MBU1472023.1 glycosyltransferase family 39 protein [candidate division Zixibacteria bacterium]MBU2624046.1 glycosyltransferase family 39 protein [candidate division Zixibacteria bacterium]
MKKHPFLVVIIVAVALRILAAIFSQGYMAHDDHFETVRIAWAWQHEGIFLDDGTLRWEGKPEIGVLRSVVYNLSLLGIMKITSAFGVEHLDVHMYFDRLIHVLLSLLPVIFGYRYLKEETDTETALAGGLILGAHFFMPFFAARNLVEMVSADLLLPALYYAHRSMKRGSDIDACVAALFGGLAFMIRMHVGLALIFVPFAMVIQNRRWRQAAIFSTAMLVVVALQGVLDVYTHGEFLGSVSNYIIGNMSQPPTIPGPWYKYILVLFGIMIPPFAILFVGSIFMKRVIRNHLILWSSLILFVAGHSAVVNKQERFVIPIFPVLIVLGCVGLYYLYKSGGWYFRWRGLRLALWGWFIVLNIILVIPFTFNYAHRGAVDPMVYLSRQDDVDGVLFDCSARKKWLPYDYWDYRKPNSVKLTPTYSINEAIVRGDLSADSPPSYVVVFTDGYPTDQIAHYSELLGRYELVHHGRPSLMDLILHRLNPKYNHKNESWVLRLIDDAPYSRLIQQLFPFHFSTI